MQNARELNRKFFFCIGLIALIACNAASPTQPVVVITEPASGSEFREGDQVVIESTSDDVKAIVRVELVVDGVVVKTDPSPTAQGQPSLTLVQAWRAIPGNHTIIVRAYNAAGKISEPVGIIVTVVPSVAQIAPTFTPNASGAINPTNAPTTAGTRAPCTNAATFVSETIPDRTNFFAGNAFNKIWRLKNSGTCTWGVGYSFGLVSGEAMASSNSLAVPAIAPGGIAELLVPMTAPATIGLHSAAWQLKSDSAQNFGPRVTIVITVSNSDLSPQVSPTTSGCSGIPTLSTFTVTTEQITEGATTRIQWGLITNASSVQIDPGIGAVNTPGVRDVSPKITTTYTLTARCGPNARTASVTIIVNPAGSAIGNFAGAWIHNFGTMTLTQSGSNVLNTSEYVNAFTTNKSKGNISGTVTGNTLLGNWSIEGVNGTLQFYLGANGNSFDGARVSEQQQLRWCGARSGSPFPSGCSFAGTWNMYFSANPACATITLTRIDDTVTGNYCGSLLNGTLQYVGSETVLNGTTSLTSGSNSFALYLIDGYNATQFQGGLVGIAGSEWCGWRGNAIKPPQCGK